MFEQNNVGVQMKTPLAECVEKMVAPESAVDPAVSARMLEATQCILDNIDGEITRTICTSWFTCIQNLMSTIVG
jgi:hypothetical protein